MPNFRKIKPLLIRARKQNVALASLGLIPGVLGHEVLANHHAPIAAFCELKLQPDPTPKQGHSFCKFMESIAVFFHASLPPQVRMQLGILGNMVRLSVGVEEMDDLTADLADALR